LRHGDRAAAKRAGKTLPLDAMLEALQDAVAIYRAAKGKVLDENTGVLLAGASDHMPDLKEKMQLVMDVATRAAPYMHPRLASVDFVAKDETRQTVVRAPELIRTADEWAEQNRKMGLLIDVTPSKDKANCDAGHRAHQEDFGLQTHST
jgi:hypothetical protein